MSILWAAQPGVGHLGRSGPQRHWSGQPVFPPTRNFPPSLEPYCWGWGTSLLVPGNPYQEGYTQDPRQVSQSPFRLFEWKMHVTSTQGAETKRTHPSTPSSSQGSLTTPFTSFLCALMGPCDYFSPPECERSGVCITTQPNNEE